jgi:hypothetical protein
MIEVKLYVDTVNQVTDVVNDVKSKGYVLGQDFDFLFFPSKYSDNGFTLVYHKHVVFRFYKDELATWFELVYK